MGHDEVLDGTWGGRVLEVRDVWACEWANGVMAGSLVNKPVIGLKKEVSEMFEFPQTPHSKIGHVGLETRTSAMTTPCLYPQSSW